MGLRAGVEGQCDIATHTEFWREPSRRQSASLRVALDGDRVTFASQPMVFETFDTADPLAVDVRKTQDLRGEFAERVATTRFVRHADPRDSRFGDALCGVLRHPAREEDEALSQSQAFCEGFPASIEKRGEARGP